MSGLVEAMCAAGAQLDALGLSPGASGNISVRVGDHLHLSPSGVSLGSLQAKGLSVFSAGEVEGSTHVAGPRPSKEWALHEAFYALNTDFCCVVHLHSTYAVAASCLPAWSEFSALPPITPYLLMRVGNMPPVGYAPPGDLTQARSLAGLACKFNAVLLQNHGPVVAGTTVQEALARAVEVEEAAKIVVALGGRPDVRLLDSEQASALSARYGQPWGMS